MPTFSDLMAPEQQSGTFSDIVGGGLTPPAPVSGGLIPAAKQMVGQTIKGAGQLAADVIPGVSQDNALKQYGQEVVAANPTAIGGLKDIVAKPVTAVKEAVGNALPSVAGGLGLRAIGQGITALSPAAGPAAPLVAGLGQAVSWGGPFVAAALPSYSGVRDKQIEADPNAKTSAVDKAVALLGAGTVGYIEQKFGPQDWALKLTTKGGREALAKMASGMTPRSAVVKGIGKGAAVEGAEELVQNPVEQLASYQNPLTAENLEETAFGGVMGALGGGVMGGGFGLASQKLDKSIEEENLRIEDKAQSDLLTQQFKTPVTVENGVATISAMGEDITAPVVDLSKHLAEGGTLATLPEIAAKIEENDAAQFAAGARQYVKQRYAPDGSGQQAVDDIVAARNARALSQVEQQNEARRLSEQIDATAPDLPGQRVAPVDRPFGGTTEEERIQAESDAEWQAQQDAAIARNQAANRSQGRMPWDSFARTTPATVEDTSRVQAREDLSRYPEAAPKTAEPEVVTNNGQVFGTKSAVLGALANQKAEGLYHIAPQDDGFVAARVDPTQFDVFTKNDGKGFATEKALRQAAAAQKVDLAEQEVIETNRGVVAIKAKQGGGNDTAREVADQNADQRRAVEVSPQPGAASDTTQEPRRPTTWGEASNRNNAQELQEDGERAQMVAPAQNLNNAHRAAQASTVQAERSPRAATSVSQIAENETQQTLSLAGEPQTFQTERAFQGYLNRNNLKEADLQVTRDNGTVTVAPKPAPPVFTAQTKSAANGYIRRNKLDATHEMVHAADGTFEVRPRPEVFNALDEAVDSGPKVRYDGKSLGLHWHTATAGPAKGTTFTTKDDTQESVAAALAAVEKRFSKKNESLDTTPGTSSGATTLGALLVQATESTNALTQKLSTLLSQVVPASKLDAVVRIDPTAKSANYKPASNTITVKDPQRLETSLHELVHAVTVRELKDNPGMQRRIDSLMLQVKREVLKQRLISSAQLKAIEGAGGSKAFKNRFPKGELSGVENIAYGLLNREEFLAQAFSSPQFQSLLKSIQINEKGALRSSWDALIEKVMQVLGISTGNKTAFDEAISIAAQLAASEVSLSRSEKVFEAPDSRSGSSPAQIETELKTFLGRGYDNLVRKNKLSIVRSQVDLPAGAPLQTRDGRVAGVYDTQTGKITLVASNVAKGDAEFLMRHEGAHALLREDKRFMAQRVKLIKAFTLLNDREQSVRDAFAKVPADTPENLILEEGLAYWLQDKTNHQHSLFKRIVAAVKSALFRLGLPTGKLGTADLAMIFTGGVKAWSTEGSSAGGGVGSLLSKISFKPVDVNSANFKKWFAGSKVVDKDGKPKVFYHASFSAFDEFKGSRYRGAHFFSSDPQRASSAALASRREMARGTAGTVDDGSREKIYPVYLKAEKLYGENYVHQEGVPHVEGRKITTEEEWDALYAEVKKAIDGKNYSDDSKINNFAKKIALQEWRSFYDTRDNGDGSYTMVLSDKRSNAESIGEMGWEIFEKGPSYGDIAGIGQKALKALGYDSAYISDEGSIDGARTVAVFSPTQIKSAISNTGALSDTDPRILFSRIDDSLKATQQKVTEAINALKDPASTKRSLYIKTAPQWLAAMPRKVLANMLKGTIPQVGTMTEHLDAMISIRTKLIDDGKVLYDKAHDLALKGPGLQAFNWAAAVSSFNRMTPWESITDQEWGSDEPTKERKLVAARNRWNNSGMKKATGKTFDVAYKQSVEAYNALGSKELKEAYQDLVDYMQNIRNREKNNLLAFIENTSEAGSDLRAKLMARYDATFNNLYGAYWPLSRFGDYRLEYTDSDGIRNVKFYDTLAARKADIDILRTQDAKEFKETYKDKSPKGSASIPMALMDQLTGEVLDQYRAKALEKVDPTDEAAVQAATALAEENAQRTIENMNQIWLRWQPETAALANSMRRGNVKGFTEDSLRSFQEYVNRHAATIAWTEQGREIEKTLNSLSESIKADKQASPDADMTFKQMVLNDIREHLHALRSTDNHPAFSVLGKFTTAHFMTSPSIALVQMSQLGVLTLPKLAVKYGVSQAGKALKNGLAMSFSKDYRRDAMFADDKVNEVYDMIHATVTDADRVAAGQPDRKLGEDLYTREQILAKVARLNAKQKKLLVLREAMARNLLDVSAVHEANEVAFGNNPDGLLATAYRYAMMPMSLSELASRKAAILSTYELATGEGKNFYSALDDIREVVDDTLFSYSKEHKPVWLQGGLARNIMTFQWYRIMSGLRIAQLFYSSIKGADQATRTAAQKEFVGIMGMTAMLAGTMGLPLLGTVFGALSLFGDSDKPEDYELMFTNWLRENFGEAAGDAIAHGLPTLAGTNLTKRLGFGDLYGMQNDAPANLHGRDLAAWWAASQLGPTFSILSGYVQGYDEMMNKGNYLKGLEVASPKPIKDALKAYRVSTEGVKTGAGKRLVADDQIGPDEIMMIALGFNPDEIARAQAANTSQIRLGTQLSERRGRLTKNAAEAILSGEGLDEAMSAIREFNTKMPRFAIGGRDIKPAVRKIVMGDLGVTGRRERAVAETWEVPSYQ